MSDKHLELVLVIWQDAWQDQENFATAHGVQQTHHPMTVQTLGWLLVDDEVGLSVANERSSENGQDVYRGRTFILRQNVVSVNHFKLTKKKGAHAVNHGTSAPVSPAE